MNLPQKDPDMKKLNTYVVSASVTNATGPIENLKEYVAVTLRHLTTKKVSGVLRNVQELKNTGRKNLTVFTFDRRTRMSSVYTGISIRMASHLY